MPTTFRELISVLGGVNALADALGVLPNTVKMMRGRNSISVERWPALIDLCASRGIILTMGDFIEMRSASKADARKAA